MAKAKKEDKTPAINLIGSTPSSLFVSCKYPRTIVDPAPTKPGEQAQSFSMPRNYIGPVPAWVQNHWYFKALCKDGTITIVANTSSNAMEDAAAAAAAKEAANRLAQEKNVKINEAMEAARLQAEATAANEGLDQIARKELIATKEAEAKAAVEAEYAE